MNPTDKTGGSPAALDQVYVTRTDIQWTVSDGEAIIVDLDGDVYYSLNQTGTRVWETLARRSALSDAVAGICECYDVSRERVLDDMAGLLADLLGSGLINVDGET